MVITAYLKLLASADNQANEVQKQQLLLNVEEGYAEVLEILNSFDQKDMRKQLFGILSGIFRDYSAKLTQRLKVDTVFAQTYCNLALANDLYFLNDLGY